MELLIILIIVMCAVFIPILAACWEVTHSWNVLRFVFDYEYWTFAIINYKYGKAKAGNGTTEDFLKSFTDTFLSRSGVRRVVHLPEKVRVEVIRLLSKPAFIEQSLGLPSYSVKDHKSVIMDWSVYVDKYCREDGDC